MEHSQGLRLPHPLGYSILAGFAKLMYAATTCAELYYFSAFLTDGAQFSVGITAMILSVTTVIDFIFSFFISVFIEAIKMPWGKYRSWLLIAPPVVIVFFTLAFVRVGANEVLSAVVIIIGFLISHFIWSIGEAAVNSMGLEMTEDPDERAKVAMWVGRGSLGNTLVFGLISAPIIAFFSPRMPQGYYAVLAFIMGVIYLIGFWALFFASSYTMKKKGVTDDTIVGGGKPDAPKRSVIRDLGTGLKYTALNRHLLVTMVCNMVTYGASILQSASMYYFFNYTLGGSWPAIMSMYISLGSVVRLIASFALVPALMKLFKHNKKAVYVTGFIGAAVCLVIAYLARGAALPCLVISTIAGVFLSTPFTMWIGLYQDCSVYSEWKAKKRIGGFIMGLSVMPIKLGIMIRSFIMSGFLVAMGYSATATDTSSYSSNFATLYLIIPAIMFLGAGIAHALIYKLPESEIKRMQDELDAEGIV